MRKIRKMMLGAVRPGLMAAVRNLTYFAPEGRRPISLVIPAKAGIQGNQGDLWPWIPAFVGMTKENEEDNTRRAT